MPVGLGSGVNRKLGGVKEPGPEGQVQGRYRGRQRVRTQGARGGVQVVGARSNRSRSKALGGWVQGVGPTGPARSTVGSVPPEAEAASQSA